MTAPLLDVRNLSVGIGSTGRLILDDVSLSLKPREIVGLVGTSGAGKTVLSKALVNWLAPPL
ncbi:MAG: peptide transporter ATPase, partial [Proteobacteria bacterium]|nr:peptide transporter ATPase [Pseudomonadota bacterium]